MVVEGAVDHEQGTKDRSCGSDLCLCGDGLGHSLHGGGSDSRDVLKAPLREWACLRAGELGSSEALQNQELSRPVASYQGSSPLSCAVVTRATWASVSVASNLRGLWTWRAGIPPQKAAYQKVIRRTQEN